MAATHGLSKLGAVNRMLWWANILSVSALDTGNPSDAGIAEEALDQVTVACLTAGFAFNVQRCKSYTPNGSFQIVLTSTVLAVRGAGSYAHRQFDAINGFVFDMDRYTNVFPDTTPVTLDVISNTGTWDDLPAAVKEYIAWNAVRKWQQTHGGDPQRDAFIIEHIEEAARTARPIRVLPGDEPMATQPFVPRMQQRQQQQ